jgi:hypothetical protein
MTYIIFRCQDVYTTINTEDGVSEESVKKLVRQKDGTECESGHRKYGNFCEKICEGR